LVVEEALERHEWGLTHPHVIHDDAGRIVGRINLGNVQHGAFQSCGVGYWVSRQANGRGLATAAVRDMKDLAFGELGLRRVEASIMTRNVGSQRVLKKNAFVRYGMAPAFAKVAGTWQDHAFYQVLRPDA
jgi:ribosomal-protein-alanine N-acetyltransferase